jgi:hypothetical protein
MSQSGKKLVSASHKLVLAPYVILYALCCDVSQILHYMHCVVMCPKYYIICTVLGCVPNITLYALCWDVSQILHYIHCVVMCPKYYIICTVLVYNQ